MASRRFDPVDGFDQSRADRTTSRQSRSHHRQLHRRGQHVALTDRGVHAITDPPFRAAGLALPILVGHQARRHARHGQIVLYTQPQTPRHVGYVLDPGPQSHFVVIDIAAFAQRARQIDVAMPRAFPAVELASADLKITRAIYRVVGHRNTGLQRRQRSDHLESRAGWIDPLHRLVGQRAVLVVQQLVVVLDRDTSHEQIRVKPRSRNAGQNIAGFAIQHNGGGTFTLQARMDIRL